MSDNKMIKMLVQYLQREIKLRALDGDLEHLRHLKTALSHVEQYKRKKGIK